MSYFASTFSLSYTDETNANMLWAALYDHGNSIAQHPNTTFLHLAEWNLGLNMVFFLSELMNDRQQGIVSSVRIGNRLRDKDEARIIMEGFLQHNPVILFDEIEQDVDQPFLFEVYHMEDIEHLLLWRLTQ